MDRNIGERFVLDGKTYEVMECGRWHSCEGCAFSRKTRPGVCADPNIDLMAVTGECNGLVRKDRKYVYFAMTP